MIFALLSARLRNWVLFAFVLPLAGRVLQGLGVRVQGRAPRAGSLLQRTGDLARSPAPRRGRRRRLR